MAAEATEATESLPKEAGLVGLDGPLDQLDLTKMLAESIEPQEQERSEETSPSTATTAGLRIGATTKTWLRSMSWPRRSRSRGSQVDRMDTSGTTYRGGNHFHPSGTDAANIAGSAPSGRSRHLPQRSAGVEDEYNNAGVDGGRQIKAGKLLAVPPKCAVRSVAVSNGRERYY